MTHFADVPHEHDLDTDQREPVERDPDVDPADDEADAGRDDFRGEQPTEQDELDKLDEGHREVD